MERMADYLAAVHESPHCLGLLSLHKERRDTLPHLRTIYRWHRTIAKELSYFPLFSLDALGLVQLHLFITQPDVRWARFPYAVESLWLTENLVEPVLYLHCLVPLIHRHKVEALLQRLPLRCANLRVVWTGNSWQRLQLGGYESLSQGFPHHAWPERHDGRVLRNRAMVIPIIGESWNQRLALPDIWTRVSQRLGPRVRAYLPAGPVYHTNGKQHVKQAYRALLHDGLFRQYLIRFPDECALFVVAPSYHRSLPLELAQVTRLAEVFPTSDGGALWRLHGRAELLHARAALGGQVIYVVERDLPPQVRWCYDWLFDPIRLRWRFSERRILRHLQVRP